MNRLALAVYPCIVTGTQSCDTYISLAMTLTEISKLVL